MSGLYDLVIGAHPLSSIFLHQLGLEQADVPRFRDTYYEHGENGQGHVVVLARIGGGNRPGYEAAIAKLRTHSLYVSDEDDTFDPTYALFRFKLPKGLEEYRERLEGMPSYGTLRDRFEKAIAAVSGG
jgi:hypothetical protein